MTISVSWLSFLKVGGEMGVKTHGSFSYQLHALLFCTATFYVVLYQISSGYRNAWEPTDSHLSILLVTTFKNMSKHDFPFIKPSWLCFIGLTFTLVTLFLHNFRDS